MRYRSALAELARYQFIEDILREAFKRTGHSAPEPFKTALGHFTFRDPRQVLRVAVMPHMETLAFNDRDPEVKSFAIHTLAYHMLHYARMYRQGQPVGFRWGLGEHGGERAFICPDEVRKMPAEQAVEMLKRAIAPAIYQMVLESKL